MQTFTKNCDEIDCFMANLVTYLVSYSLTVAMSLISFLDYIYFTDFFGWIVYYNKSESDIFVQVSPTRSPTDSRKWC